MKSYLDEPAVLREKFDYISWRRDYFDSKTSEEISRKAETFEREDPYTGEAGQL